MKILQVGNYNPFEVNGGIEVATLNICDVLGRNGHDVTLICSSKKSKSTSSFEHYKIANLYSRLSIFELPIFSLSNISMMAKGIKAADVVHIHYPNPITTFIASVLSKIYHKKFVLSVHTHIGIDESSEKRGILYKQLSYINNVLFLKYALKNASKILVPSPSFLLYSKYTKKFEYKSSVVPNGVDTSKFNPMIDGQIIRKKLSINKKILLFVGSLNSSHKGKGLTKLMDALKILLADHIDVRLVVVGDGDMKSTYMDYAKSIGISDKVAFTGRASDNELPYYYAAADIFALPSVWYESFGIVLIEAMACGKPVIGSSIGGIPYVIGDAGILVPPNDVNKLASELNSLLSNEDLARSIGSKCRDRVLENFVWDKSVDKITNIYNEVIKAGG